MLCKVLRQCIPDCRVKGRCGWRDHVRLWCAEDRHGRRPRGGCGRRIFFVGRRLLARCSSSLWLWRCICVCTGGCAGMCRRLGEFVDYLRTSDVWILQAIRVVSPHPGDPGCTAVSWATQRCNCRLAMSIAVTAGGTHESSEPSSAAFCRTSCATDSQHVTSHNARAAPRRCHIPEVMAAGAGRSRLFVCAEAR